MKPSPLLACALLSILSLGLGCGRPRVDNLVLIVVDTLRADHLTLYGYPRATSPQLDQWAARGVIFDQALATSPWTLPTFGSVLTGLWPAQHAAGVRAPTGNKRWRRAPLRSDVSTLPEILQANGVVTGAIVNNAFLRPHFGVARGFDHYDYEKGREASDVVELALDWLRRQGDRRFFLMLHFIDPHLPYEPPADYLGRFGQVSEEAVPARGRKKIVEQLATLSDLDRQSLVDRYDEEIAALDEQLGRLLRSLESAGLLDTTLVALTSDHGEELFDHGGFEHGHSMYQEVLRVPLILWAPDLQARRIGTPISLVDLMPTLAEALGVAVESGLTGRSQWRQLREGRQRLGPQEILAQNTLWGREHRAFVRWPYKLILDPRTDRRQLFDLASDPLETVDLASTEPEIAAELELRLRHRLADLEQRPSEEGLELTEEMERELEALGYLE